MIINYHIKIKQFKLNIIFYLTNKSGFSNSLGYTVVVLNSNANRNEGLTEMEIAKMLQSITN